MNILDENIPESQRRLLQGWRIRVRQVGHEVGRAGMKDEQLIAMFHRLQRPTFFTRDLGFYDRRLRHQRYTIVCLAVGSSDAASFIRRYLRHPGFASGGRRAGSIALVSHRGVRLWRQHADAETRVEWP